MSVNYQSIPVDPNYKQTKKSLSNTIKSLSLLDVQAYTLIPALTLIYVILQTLVGIIGLCKNNESMALWVSNINLFAISLLLINCVAQLIQILFLIQQKKKKAYTNSRIKIHSSLVFISAVAGSSQLLTYGLNYGGICKDPLGVESPAAQWCEWLLLVPFMAYLSCAVEHKRELEFIDKIIIFNVFLTILFGFFMIFPTHVMYTIIFLFLSCVSMVIVLVCIFNKTGIQPTLSFNYEEEVDLLTYMSAKQTYRSISLLYQLGLILSYFPIVYVFGMIDLIDADVVIAAYIIGSVIGKLIFSSLVIQWHSNIQEEFYMLKEEVVYVIVICDIRNCTPMKINSTVKFKPLAVSRVSLLDFQAYNAITIVIFLYIFCQSLMGCSTFCTVSNTSISMWTSNINLTAISCLFCNLIIQLIHITSIISRNDLKTSRHSTSRLKVHACLATISAVACSSQSLTYILNYGGICRDAMGVASPAGQWSEWLSLVPFLAYLACAMEHKKNLGRVDTGIVVCVGLMILFGFLMVFPISKTLCTVFLICSCVNMLFIYYLIGMKQGFTPSLSFTATEEELALLDYMSEKQTYRSISLQNQLAVIILYFPTVYFLGMFRFLDDNAVIGSYIVGSVMAKLIFSSFIIQWHEIIQDEFYLLKEDEIQMIG